MGIFGQVWESLQLKIVNQKGITLDRIQQDTGFAIEHPSDYPNLS